MSHVISVLIMFRIIFCPLFCGVEAMFAQTEVGPAARQVQEACCSCCHAKPVMSQPVNPQASNSSDSESTPLQDCPRHSSSDCDCFCSQSAIVGVKVDLGLDGIDRSIWEGFLALPSPSRPMDRYRQVDVKGLTWTSGISPGRFMRLMLASLLI